MYIAASPNVPMTDGVGRYSSAISSQTRAPPSMTFRILASERLFVAISACCQGAQRCCHQSAWSRSGRRSSAPNQT